MRILHPAIESFTLVIIPMIQEVAYKHALYTYTAKVRQCLVYLIRVQHWRLCLKDPTCMSHFTLIMH